MGYNLFLCIFYVLLIQTCYSLCNSSPNSMSFNDKITGNQLMCIGNTGVTEIQSDLVVKGNSFDTLWNQVFPSSPLPPPLPSSSGQNLFNTVWITNSQTWTVPKNIYIVKFTVYGGGGGSTFPCSGTQSGSSGAYLEVYVPVTPGTSFIFTIGTGGVSVPGGDTVISYINIANIIAGGGQHYTCISNCGGKAICPSSSCFSVQGNDASFWKLTNGGSSFGAYGGGPDVGFGGAGTCTSTITTKGRPGVIIIQY